MRRRRHTVLVVPVKLLLGICPYALHLTACQTVASVPPDSIAHHGGGSLIRNDDDLWPGSFVVRSEMS